jgi:hypothetical protein
MIRLVKIQSLRKIGIISKFYKGMYVGGLIYRENDPLIKPSALGNQ